MIRTPRFASSKYPRLRHVFPIKTNLLFASWNLRRSGDVNKRVYVLLEHEIKRRWRFLEEENKYELIHFRSVNIELFNGSTSEDYANKFDGMVWGINKLITMKKEICVLRK